MPFLRRRSLLCLSILLALTPTEGVAQALADHQYTSAAIEAGGRLYGTECALCHGPNGDGVDGVDLRLGQFRHPLSDFALRQLITTGLAEARMPGFDFEPAELDSLVAFIRAGFDPEGVAVKVGDVRRGQALFEGAGGCSSCHRVNGRGPRTAPDLSAIGVSRTPAALQRTLLDPAAALLPINRPVQAATRSGEIINGRRLNEDTYTVQLIDSEERLRSLVKADLVEFEVMRTPTMEPTVLSSEQVADVIGYLLTLRGLQ
ncbi:MAG TPA: c-type cytochrome [Acidobacteriota bacterium]|nr:c-type cytochrome [Acidobacteriota bacterium]